MPELQSFKAGDLSVQIYDGAQRITGNPPKNDKVWDISIELGVRVEKIIVKNKTRPIFCRVQSQGHWRLADISWKSLTNLITSAKKERSPFLKQRQTVRLRMKHK